MRVAFVLNGLTRDVEFLTGDLANLTIKLKEKYGIDSDFYCHFWSNQGVYFYDNTPFNGTIPIQNPLGIEKVLVNLDPVSYKISKSIDMQSDFVEYYHHLKSINHLVIKNFNTSQRSEYKHNKWRMFCNKFSQLYGFESAVQLVKESGVTYDAIIRFRYDVLYDSEKSIVALVNALKSQINNMVVQDFKKYSALTRYAETETITDLSKTLDSKFEYGMGDVMFLSSADNMIAYAENIYKNSIATLLKIQESLHYVYPTEIFWLNAALDKNISLTANSRLFSSIVRNKNELSKIYRQNISAAVSSLSNFRYPTDTFQGSIKNND